jgi:hypothetical protein
MRSDRHAVHLSVVGVTSVTLPAENPESSPAVRIAVAES